MTVATVLRERFDLGPVLWDAKRNEGRGSERERERGGEVGRWGKSLCRA